MARATTSAASNNSLGAAKKAKNDEFYTQLTDIEKELQHYKGHFKGKVVFCNCDDPEWSNFWKFFTLNFEHLERAKVVATHYASGGPSYKLEYTGKGNPLVKTPLAGDGDFRSAECVALLKQADIVVTNPPFSLFREYVAHLVEQKKKFLIIGNQNALTYLDVFALFKSNEIWAGVDNGGTKWFRVPFHYDIQTESRIRVIDGVKYFSMGSIYWFTNLPHHKRNEELVLFKQYAQNTSAYPTYENYDAIEVGKVADIPADWEGVMGVPITFLDKYNPEQFEILGMCENRNLYGLKTKVYSIQECKDSYLRHFGKPGTYDLNAAGVIGGKKVYQRLLIKRRK